MKHINIMKCWIVKHTEVAICETMECWSCCRCSRWCPNSDMGRYKFGTTQQDDCFISNQQGCSRHRTSCSKVWISSERTRSRKELLVWAIISGENDEMIRYDTVLYSFWHLGFAKSRGDADSAAKRSNTYCVSAVMLKIHLVVELGCGTM